MFSSNEPVDITLALQAPPPSTQPSPPSTTATTAATTTAKSVTVATSASQPAVLVPLSPAAVLSITKSKKWQNILAHIDAAWEKEADVYHSLMQHLKLIKKLTLLFKLFGLDRLSDIALYISW